MTKTILKKLTVFCFVAVTINCNAQECAVCNQYLDKLYDVISIQKSADFKESFKSWFFSQSFFNEVKNNKAGLSITVPIYGVPVTFGGSYESNDAWQKWEQNMNSTQWDFSKITKENIFTQIATDQSREIWLQCVKSVCASQNERFHIETSTNNDKVIFTVSYNANMIDGKPPVYESFECNGFDCSNATKLYKGKQMKKTGQAITIKWLNKDIAEGSLILNTSKGSSTVVNINRKINLKEGVLVVIKDYSGNLDNVDDLIKVGATSEDQLVAAGSEDHKSVYKHAFKAAPEQTLRNFEYHCVEEGYPCGWTSIDNDQKNGREIWVTIRSWGPLEKWRFSYDIYKAKTLLRQDSTTLKISDDLVTVNVPKNSFFPVVYLRLENGKDLVFNPQGKLPNSIKLIQSNSDENTFYYIFKIIKA